MKLKVNNFLNKYQKEILLFLIVVLLSLLSFALGYIVAKQELKEPLRIEKETTLKLNYI
jgi:hypothetical protein